MTGGSENCQEVEGAAPTGAIVGVGTPEAVVPQHQAVLYAAASVPDRALQGAHAGRPSDHATKPDAGHRPTVDHLHGRERQRDGREHQKNYQEHQSPN